MRIYKYPLALAMAPAILMPDGAEILSVGIQHNMIMLWAKVDPGNIHKPYQFYIVGTGHDMPDDVKYIGTVQQDVFVWHVFQELPT